MGDDTEPPWWQRAVIWAGLVWLFPFLLLGAFFGRPACYVFLGGAGFAALAYAFLRHNAPRP